jgi:hypothetical protein
MARGLGLDELALPQPRPGMPSQYRPAGAKPAGAQERTLTGVLQDVPDSTLASLASISSRVIRGAFRTPARAEIACNLEFQPPIAHYYRLCHHPHTRLCRHPHTARISSE